MFVCGENYSQENRQNIKESERKIEQNHSFVGKTIVKPEKLNRMDFSI